MMILPPRLNGVDLTEMRDDVLGFPIRDAAYGDYPWDRWVTKAAAAGLTDDLLSLGREVFREAYQHQWREELWAEVGWIDGGAKMLCQALAFPEKAMKRWGHLLETDGNPRPRGPAKLLCDPVALCYALRRCGHTIEGILLPPEPT